MVVPKQLIIIRFYGSGTSMLTQELYKAGLFVRERLLCSDISNAYGYFWEDPMLAYKMWLSYNQHILRHIEKHPDRTVIEHSILKYFKSFRYFCKNMAHNG